ncbi:DUF3109 family protein [Flavobacterium sp. ASW18X]|uniref:DUF3109 family protein n=1 Tax=Flavobacterium sp. ASW18X TaxID=2572595 RepID=UPI0010ADE78B|nr:DUF3109 family protein [Flavobacterium sp. ASW18X]TKD67260.1 DUF3109 family protein [Flavobacterium sp. ASW18X]
MFQIDSTLISEEILENDFVCNLNACKGACCIEGSSGAPLTEDELPILEQIYTAVTPYLREEGKKAIAEQGVFVKGMDGEWETPLVNGEECAYVAFSDDGIAKCGIEEAYNDGKIDWKKPVSCHLYPVRTRAYTEFTAVNYHKWTICDPACALGEELKVPIYKFVKDALIRKFGTTWYAELEKVAEQHLNK